MEDAGRIETDAMLADLERRLNREYAQAAREVREKTIDYLAEFREKDRVWRRKLAMGKITEKEYRDWRMNQMLVGKRWEDMANELARDFHRTNVIAKGMINEEKQEVYAENFNYGTFEAETGSMVNTSFTLYDRHTVARLMRDDPDLLPPPGQKVSAAIAAGKDLLWNRQMIQSVMTQGILQGESIPKLATRLATAVGDSNRAAAIRNARTMTTGAECAGRVDSYKRAEGMGIRMRQQWISTLDGRTRDSHVDMDGEVIDVGGTFSNKCRFPGDPQGPAGEVYNCRCTLIAQIEGYEIDVVSERQVDPDLGGISYAEWKAQHGRRRA